MRTQDIYMSGMHCDACEKTITRVLDRIGVRVVSIRHTDPRVRIEYTDDRLVFTDIVKAINDVGYDATETMPAVTKSLSFIGHVRNIKRSLLSDREAYVTEKRILWSTLATLGVVAALEYLMYFIFFWNTENFWIQHGQYIAYLTVAVVALGGAIKHQRAYRGAVSCMSGMMIGMTIGMMAGLLIGIVIGATNGMFVGSVFTMAVAMGVGAWVGACCGVMGAMEGLMAGLMGGTMGPMLAVMLISDRIGYFFPIFFIACLIILGGLSYMVYKENKGRTPDVRPYAFWPYTFVNAGVVIIGTILIVAGPRAAFLQ
ncbi:MAG: heavy-metal-associated domain-containing protein [Patescibacteria group bacterium]|jgi:copper chaperone CopZ